MMAAPRYEPPRHDAHGRIIRVGDRVRFVKNPAEIREVADFDTLAYTGVRFTNGNWTQARHLEVVEDAGDGLSRSTSTHLETA